MKEFKVGDKVKRITTYGHGGMKPGDIGTVESIHRNGYSRRVVIKEYKGDNGNYRHNPNSLELVEEEFEVGDEVIIISWDYATIKTPQKGIIINIDNCSSTPYQIKIEIDHRGDENESWFFKKEEFIKAEKEIIPEYIKVIENGCNNTSHPKSKKSLDHKSVGTILKVLEYDPTGGYNYKNMGSYVCEDQYVIYKALCEPSTKEAFEEQNKPKFREGDWLYGGICGSEFIFRFKSYDSLKDRFTTDEYYQIHSNGGLSIGKSDNWSSINKARLATDEEVKRILTKVAEIKYPIGTRFKCVNGNTDSRHEDSIFNVHDYNYLLTSRGATEGVHCGNGWIYLNGKWAEIVEDPRPKLKMFGYDVEYLRFTQQFKVGCKWFHLREVEYCEMLFRNPIVRVTLEVDGFIEINKYNIRDLLEFKKLVEEYEGRKRN